jgi:hypothetical protein
MQLDYRQNQEHANMWNDAQLQYEQIIAVLNHKVNDFEADVAKLNGVNDSLNKRSTFS